jgi:hypothetical protein
MGASSNPVRLQMLLRAPWRNDRGLADVQTALRALHLEVTGVGRASVSARASQQAFDSVFGGAPPEVMDAAGPDADVPLAVPSALAEWVESITVAPQHIVMSETPSPATTERSVRQRQKPEKQKGHS